MLLSKLALVFGASLILQMTLLYNKSEHISMKYHFPGFHEWNRPEDYIVKLFSSDGPVVKVLSTINGTFIRISRYFTCWGELGRILCILLNTFSTGMYGLWLWSRENPRLVIFSTATVIIACIDSNLRQTLKALLIEKAEVNQRLNRINTLVRTVTVVEQWNRALEDLENKTQMVRECVEYWKQIREAVANQNDPNALQTVMDGLLTHPARKECGDVGLPSTTNGTKNDMVESSG